MQGKLTDNSIQRSWWQKLLALIALINLVLVLFNLSYLSLRDFYFNNAPILIRIYDPVKAIEPHPDTEAYLDTVARLQQAIARSSLTSDSTEQLLASLRQQSIFLIEENPFTASNKLGTFAKLKHRMEYRLQARSTKEAFNRFWSREYLAQADTARELEFFNQKIEPLLKVNYYRHIDANGIESDRFWRIDLFFVIFFALEYFSRTFQIARNQAKLSWWNAMLRYWYDALMLIFIGRWLRIVPVTVRIHKSGLFNLEEILRQITHEPAAYISQRVSTFLIVRLLNQSQEIISDGTLVNVLLSSNEGIEVGETDKIDKIIDRLISLTIYHVLPQVQPDLENLLRYSLKGALQESDIYQTVEKIPGFTDIPQETIEQLSDYLARATYDVLLDSYTDAQGKIIFNRFSQNFSDTLKQQIQTKATYNEIANLLSDLLEEWKLNYVKNSRQRNPEQTLAEAEQIKTDLT
ncbi:hypothetical protein IQ255_01150 [Pleurocapsales cyanobacterium LEGE 10410]|nr:hypothetical protein [Pleurocapsales cyanobacterium LEGE 10410]